MNSTEMTQGVDGSVELVWVDSFHFPTYDSEQEFSDRIKRLRVDARYEEVDFGIVEVTIAAQEMTTRDLADLAFVVNEVLFIDGGQPSEGQEVWIRSTGSNNGTVWYQIVNGGHGVQYVQAADLYATFRNYQWHHQADLRAEAEEISARQEGRV